MGATRGGREASSEASAITQRREKMVGGLDGGDNRSDSVFFSECKPTRFAAGSDVRWEIKPKTSPRFLA